MRAYSVKFSSNRTRLTLRIAPDGALEVRAPVGTPDAVVRAFVRKNEEWIAERETEFAEKGTDVAHQFVPGEKFYYLGERYTLEYADFPGGRARLGAGVLQTSEREPEGVARQLERFYRKQAAALLETKARDLAAANGLEIVRVSITAAGTRWGSCSARKTLNFPWNLVMCPEEAVDYVVAHEVAHLVHLNHSKNFWALVGRWCPDWRTQHRFLRAEGMVFQKWRIANE